ncbi:mitochondrial import inner membrane translocase subunit TIM10 [Terfezia boudieri ATCC MYA-4762]|uniref:Mitochondrial import inner membrane translocase subunit n=1 Tax=Terfezia boudieri ATCC MYA-4762 TaxID=1051890 RepID=A0A3N4LJI8_9PEZI|nr:mitochondrial import inner membrane translocase subunit TIM10 [Terfezia boudieri ATCC MYA-4762]
MSFLGFGARPQPTSAEKLAMAEMEMDIMAHMINKLGNTCFKKCVNNDYKDTELNKGESVCLDRCVHKFVEAFQKVPYTLNLSKQHGNGLTQYT